MTPTPADLAFYERKRRLAYYFAWASMAFLFLELSVGFLLELYSHPRAVAAADGVGVVHRALNPDDADASRLLLLDVDLKPRAEPLSLPDPATALLPEGRDVTIFFGAHAALLVDGKISRSVDLGQGWDVLCALPDPGGAWIFGWSKDRIVARRREKDAWGPEFPVATSAAVDRIAATRDGAAGPLVAWRERDTGKVKTALHDGQAFVPGAEFEIGAVEHWDVLLHEGRRLLVTYNRDDRSFRYVTLRLECCAGCPRPIAARKVAFADPVLLLGRKVTGLATAVLGGRLRFFITRMSTLMTASMPLSTLEPEPAAAKLVSIGSGSPWKHLAASIPPFLLAFSSFAMIFLGFTLFRERSRIARGLPADPMQPADFLPRAMAFFLDHFLLLPAIYLVCEILDVAPDTMLMEADDPRVTQAAATILGVVFLYYFVLEWLLGATLGKRILGLKVAQLDGSKLTLKGALLRTLIRLLDAESLPLVLAGTASLLFTKRRQRLGDLAARTVVLIDRS